MPYPAGTLSRTSEHGAVSNACSQTKTIIFTIGHSNHPIDRFISLLKRHLVTAVVDVRTTPFSRFCEQYNRENLASSLRNAGIAYIFLGEQLGARPNDNSCYTNGNADFSLMANRTDFKNALRRVKKGSKKHIIALMCAEREPLDCHRTILVCRNLKSQDVEIIHILYDGSLENHLDTEFRLIRETDSQRDLLTQEKSDSEILEEAYEKRAKSICYKQKAFEAIHE